MHKFAEYSIINSRPEAVRYALRSQIISGGIAPGEKLPPTDELARMYNVSKDTISHAMSLLAEEKLIVRRRGAGTFAAPDLKYIPEPGCRNIGIYLPMLKSDRELLDPQISPTTFQLFTGALEALK
ncbi:MAG: winged helix-turn-helix transcriptional regulator, partial [Lentisphaeria bacterium]|nr:winged helix-turn-helix transcriptional regulator [Lentisphaeria bacterium]